MTTHVVSRSIDPYGPKGGLERAVRLVVEELRRRGETVLVYTTPPAGSADLQLATANEKPLFIPWPRLPRPFSTLKSSLRWQWEYLAWTVEASANVRRRFRVGDVLYLQGAAGLGANFLPARIRRATAINPHGMEEWGQTGIRGLARLGLLRAGLKRASRRVGAVIATDSSMQEVVRKRFPAAAVHVLPNAIDAQLLIHSTRNHPLPAQSASTLTVLTVGRVEFNKGYDVLAAALAQVTQYDWRWTHHGSGSEISTLKALICSLGIDPRVTIREDSSDNDIALAMAACDVFVQPSRYEGSSLTTLEALLLAPIVIGTATGGIPDKLRTPQIGVLVRPGDSVELARALVTVFTGEHEVVRGAGRHLVLSQFDIKAVGDRYTALQELLRRA